MRLALALAAALAMAMPAQAQEVEAAQEFVKRQLKDPESARFRDVAPAPGNMVCGWYNAKNSFGGYGGESFFQVIFINGYPARFNRGFDLAREVELHLECDRMYNG